MLSGVWITFPLDISTEFRSNISSIALRIRPSIWLSYPGIMEEDSFAVKIPTGAEKIHYAIFPKNIDYQTSDAGILFREFYKVLHKCDAFRCLDHISPGYKHGV